MIHRGYLRGAADVAGEFDCPHTGDSAVTLTELKLSELFAYPLAGRAIGRGVQANTWGVLTAAWVTSLTASVLARGRYPDGYASLSLTALSMAVQLRGC
jgi:hypothetical protein